MKMFCFLPRFASLQTPSTQFTYARQFSSKEPDHKTPPAPKKSGKPTHTQGTSENFDASDALVQDITHATLLSPISKKLGVTYLSVPTKAETKKITYLTKGMIYGGDGRVMVPFVVSNLKGGVACRVIFLADTRAPHTFLSPQACTALSLCEDFLVSVEIGGHECTAGFSHPVSNFKDINLLGADFLKGHAVFIGLDYGSGEAYFCFGRGWKPFKDPKM